MKDVTDYARKLGYKGDKPILVKDGYVVSPFRQFWPSFCHDLKVQAIKAQIKPGVLVRYDDLSLRSQGEAEVVSVKGNFAVVRWPEGYTSHEHIPSLEIVPEKQGAAA